MYLLFGYIMNWFLNFFRKVPKFNHLKDITSYYERAYFTVSKDGFIVIHPDSDILFNRPGQMGELYSFNSRKLFYKGLKNKKTLILNGLEYKIILEPSLQVNDFFIDLSKDYYMKLELL